MKRLLLCITIIFLLVFFPLFKKGKITLNANHLVAFYQPWASSPELGWGVSVHHKPLGDDDLWIFYPQRTFTQKTLSVFHEIPFWNPLSFAGNHHAGLSETAIFYPFNLLFFVFPQITAWTLLTIMQPFAIAVGMYLFLRKLFGTNSQAIYGAMVFAFCSLVIVRMVEGLSVGHTLLWLPYVFWCIESYRQKSLLRYLVMLLIFLVSSFTAGWFQYTFYIFALGFIYALYRCKQQRQRIIFIPFVLFPFYALYHLVPIVAAFLESPRGLDGNRIVQNLHLAPIQHLATLLFPDFWGNPATFNYFGPLPYKEALIAVGVIPIIFALIALYSWRGHWIPRFFGGILIVTLLMGIKSPISQWIVTLPIPVMSTFIPSRIFTLSAFALSVLAAYGIGFLFDASKRNMVLRFGFAVGLICIMLSLSIWGAYFWSNTTQTLAPTIRDLLMVGKLEHLKSQARNTLLPTALVGICITILIIFRKKKSHDVFIVVAIFIVTSGQLWYNAHKYLAFSQSEYIYPPHPLFTAISERIGFDRYVSMGTAHIATNVPLEFGLPSIEGAGSMYIRRYGELLSYVTDREHRIDQVLRIESYINPQTQELLTGNDRVMERFLEIAGVRYMTSLDNDRDALLSSASVSANYHLVWQQAHWQLWENVHTQPRTFVTGDFAVQNTTDAILSDMFHSGVSGRHVVIEQDPGFPSVPQATGSAIIDTYSPNSITIRATADHPALVYLSDTYSHTFRATVDGIVVPILRANYAFRAVPIPAGTHTVVMHYSMTPWKVGTAISVVLWITSGLMCFVMVYTKRMQW